MDDPTNGLAQRGPCAEPGCGETVIFSILGSAVRSDPIRHWGDCPLGHHNHYIPANGHRRVVQDEDD
jgi:hypothetical protein